MTHQRNFPRVVFAVLMIASAVACTGVSAFPFTGELDRVVFRLIE